MNVSAQKSIAVFLDRDGVMNTERSYIIKPEDLELFWYTPKALSLIGNAGYKTIVVTNQSAIARGMFTLTDLENIHERMRMELEKKGANLDAIYLCPHMPVEANTTPENEFQTDCSCRKPKPGMLLQAARDWNIDLKKSIMIGDTARDMEAGKQAGCYTIGVRTGYGLKDYKHTPDFLADNLLDAALIVTSKEYANLFDHLQIELNKIEKPLIIGIGGNSRTGKSSLAAYLKMHFELHGNKTLLIQSDQGTKVSEAQAYVEFNPKSHTPEFMVCTLAEILDKTDLPDIILIEGKTVLTHEPLLKLLHLKILLETTEKKRKQRFKEYFSWQEIPEDEQELLLKQIIEQEFLLEILPGNHADFVIQT
ncbi:MAG: HAD-IIIA family hydrolase [Bacteroidota bacterium]|nr:MAG: HAD-IIIA family hydrolase [Bacteroidota bacterium]